MVPGHRPRILLVDDDPANRAALRRLLGRLDVDIHEAADGNSALALTLDHEFALALLDLRMPGMDGLEVSRLLRASEHGRQLPVIFVTADHADAERLLAYAAGAADYLTKPVNRTVLLAKVNNFIELDRSRSELRHALDELDRRNRQLEQEISERRRAEKRALQLAMQDPLTGLPNRGAYLAELEAAMRRADRAGPLAVAYLDLDGFKAINDSYGHQVGDQVLCAFAEQLRGRLRASDTLARFGGDEFALVLEGIRAHASPDELARTLALHQGRELRVGCGGRSLEVRVAASAGLALYPRDGVRVDALLDAADRALYAAKRAGKGRTCLYSPALAPRLTTSAAADGQRS